MSSLPGTLNVRIKFCHSIGMHDLVVGSEPTQQAMLSEGSDPANPPNQNIRTKFILKKYTKNSTDTAAVMPGADDGKFTALGVRAPVFSTPSTPSLYRYNVSQRSGHVHLFSQPRRRRVCICMM